MTNHQKLRQLSVKQLAKLLVKYCPDVNYYNSYYDDDDDYDYGDYSYYTFIQLNGTESSIHCEDEEMAIMECMNYLNAQYKTEELNNENKKI